MANRTISGADIIEGRLRIQEQRVDAGLATLQTQVQTTISRLDRIETKIDALVR